MNHLPHQLGQLLLRRKAITATQLAEALQLQQRSSQGLPLGQALITLGYLDEHTLQRTLRQQRWLRPCAACFVLMAPFSATYADDADGEPGFTQDWLESTHWYQGEQGYISDDSASADVLKFVAQTAWDIYQGEPLAGEVRYSVSNPQEHSYQLEMTIRF